MRTPTWGWDYMLTRLVERTPGEGAPPAARPLGAADEDVAREIQRATVQGERRVVASEAETEAPSDVGG